MSKQAFDRKMDALEALRAAPVSECVSALRKALKDRNNYAASKAAAMAGELGLKDLIPDLTAAFVRFMTDPVKSDPQCWAKNAIAKALKDLDYSEPDFYLSGMRHVQMEPVWGGKQDSAPPLRGACALALVACPLPRFGILAHLVEALAADPAKTVRIDAARALAQIPGPDSVLLLRLKVLASDAEPAVTGQCMAALVAISPDDSIPFVARFLDGPDGNVRMEAAAALGECREPEAVEALQKAWRAHKDPDTRRGILLSLGASPLQIAAEFLVSVIEEGMSEDSGNAIRALAAGRFRNEYREKVAKAIESRPHLAAIFKKEFA